MALLGAVAAFSQKMFLFVSFVWFSWGEGAAFSRFSQKMFLFVSIVCRWSGSAGGGGSLLRLQILPRTQ